MALRGRRITLSRWERSWPASDEPAARAPPEVRGSRRTLAPGGTSRSACRPGGSLTGRNAVRHATPLIFPGRSGGSLKTSFRSWHPGCGAETAIPGALTERTWQPAVRPERVDAAALAPQLPSGSGRSPGDVNLDTHLAASAFRKVGLPDTALFPQGAWSSSPGIGALREARPRVLRPRREREWHGGEARATLPLPGGR